MYDPSHFFADASRRVRLRDGSYSRIRRSSAMDRPLLAQCFQRLSPDSRRRRFFTSKPTLSEDELDFLTGADGRSHMALVAVGLGTSGEETHALGFTRCIRLAQAPETAEMSIAVADETQRLGIGAALLDQLTAVARSRGIRRLFCEVLADNHGMRALAKRAGGKPHWNGDGTVEYDWRLPDATIVDDALWTAGPNGDFAGSVEVGLTMFEWAMRTWIDSYEATIRHASHAQPFSVPPYCA